MAQPSEVGTFERGRQQGIADTVALLLMGVPLDSILRALTAQSPGREGGRVRVRRCRDGH